MCVTVVHDVLDVASVCKAGLTFLARNLRVIYEPRQCGLESVSQAPCQDLVKDRADGDGPVVTLEVTRTQRLQILVRGFLLRTGVLEKFSTSNNRTSPEIIRYSIAPSARVNDTLHSNAGVYRPLPERTCGAPLFLPFFLSCG